MAGNQDIHVLVIDDEPLNLEIVMHSLDKEGYKITCTGDAEKALALLHAKDDEEFDVILLDRQLPGMNGLELLKRIKQNARSKHIPVIMQTALGRDSERREGIEAGAYYYLSKPYDSKSLIDIVARAANDVRNEKGRIDELRRSTVIYDLIEHCELKVRTLNDVRRAATYLANLFPEPERVSFGIYELTLNAVEHGNLELGYDKKGQFLTENDWEQEIDRRLALPENAGKCVTIEYRKTRNGITLTITDQGSGFDWKSYMQIDPNRAEDNHGRSIAISNMRCFDKLTYNDKGNQVTASVTLSEF